jgi:hypothetical protein
MPVSERKIAIVGSAATTRSQAPFNDPSWEIWCCGGDTSKVTPRFDRWYETHSLDILLDEKDADYAPYQPAHVQQMVEHGPKTFLMQPSPRAPFATPIPWEAIVDTFDGSVFLTSTPAMMIAHAMFEGFKEAHAAGAGRILSHLTIGLFGVEMCSDGEYAYQKAGVLHFMNALAMFDGKAMVPAGTSLEDRPLPYPLNVESPQNMNGRTRMGMFNKALAQIDQHVANLDAQKMAALQQKWHTQGRIDELKHSIMNWS